MRILFVVDAFRGGAGNVIQILSREFKRRGNDCVILLTNGKIAEPKYDLTGIKVIDYKLEEHIHAKNAADRIIKYTKELKTKFHEIQPDAIISFLTTNNILSCMANDLNVPLLVSERIDPFKAHTKIHWRLLRKIYYARAKKIIVQCSNFEDFFTGQLKKKTVTIANPIITPVNDYQARENHGNIIFISIGRITEQKNFPWMCDRMKEIHNQHECVELRIFGNGDKEEYLREKKKKNDMEDYVKLMGYTDNPYSELQNADIYLMTSDYEGFPNSLSEAMAVGLPSVSRMCHSGIQDLVKDSINGYLVAMEDKAGFVAKCVELASSVEQRKEISEKAKEISYQYSVERIVARWESLIS